IAADGAAWTPLAWTRDGAVVAVASGADRAFVLLGTQADSRATKVERVLLAGGTLAAQPIPDLPAPLGSPRGAVHRETLYVAGASPKSAMQLFTLDLAAASMAWRAQDGWPANAVAVTSLVAQTGAVWVTAAERPAGEERLFRWTAKEGWKD